MGEYGDMICMCVLISIDKLVCWMLQIGCNCLYLMIENCFDWVLLCQCVWGVLLICFVRKGVWFDDVDFLLCDQCVNDCIIEVFEKDGVDVWYYVDFKVMMLDGVVDFEVYDQVMDVLDVWFDLGLIYVFVICDCVDGSLDGIVDLYLEGIDQYCGWFYFLLL